MVILAAAAAILTMSVGAELSDGSVSNLLAPLYGNAQTELVDNVGRPVDASVTVNGYTLTADAVIGDRYNIAIVYTLTRDDGQPIPENVSFDSYSNAYHNFSSGGGSWQYCRDGDLPDNQLRIVERWTSSAVLPFSGASMWSLRIWSFWIRKAANGLPWQREPGSCALQPATGIPPFSSLRRY